MSALCRDQSSSEYCRDERSSALCRDQSSSAWYRDNTAVKIKMDYTESRMGSKTRNLHGSADSQSPSQRSASVSFYSCLNNYPVHTYRGKQGRMITLSVC